MARKTCNPYDGGEIPPCSAFLGNEEPIIKYGKAIYRNENRVYCFISTVPNPKVEIEQTPETTSPITNKPFVSVNIQISLPTFIIGMFVNKMHLGAIKYDENMSIHSDRAANDFIHKLLRKQPQVLADYIPKLSLIVSNSSAILPLYTYAADITPLNFYILFLLNRFERNPGLFFASNSFTTEDPINFTLAALNIW